MKKTERIEVYERYVANKEEVDYLKDLGTDGWWEQIEYSYRRTNPLWIDIERIIEIPGDDENCKVRFYQGYFMTVRYNYDELCILQNDWENGIEVSNM